MEFGAEPTERALGAILAHSLKLPEARLKKGQLLTAADISSLQKAGIGQVTVARLSQDDVSEDVAAARLAAELVPKPDAVGLRLTKAATGRVNVYATSPGVIVLDATDIGALNRVDPMITLATLAPLSRVVPRQLVATIKIIAYAVPEAALAAACAAAPDALRIQLATCADASLILTETPGRPEMPNGKGARAIEGRLKRLGVDLAETRVVAHETGALAEAIRAATGRAILILTASATSDIRDVAPAAVMLAGGEVTRFGMPVDPGNLLFLGSADSRPVIGLPGCARSPALNGADWVMERVLCGIDVTHDDIAGMGVGGLLKEGPARPHPREKT